MSNHWTIHFYPEVTSTQDVAKQLIGDGASGLFVVQTGHQTKGRGRSGRRWSSLEGNLQATLCVPMDFDVAKAANYSFLISLSVSAALDAFLQLGQEDEAQLSYKIEHKWPNDVWVNGRKICGILLEIHDRYLLVGCGVNLQNSLEENICLSQLTDREIDIRGFLNIVLSKIDFYREVLESDGFGVILDLWTKQARGVGEEIMVRTVTEQFTGIFDGLEPNGALRVFVDCEGKQHFRIIHSADVFFAKT